MSSAPFYTWFYILFLFMASPLLHGQENLIPNPSFEEYFDCDYDVGGLDNLNTVIPHWNSRVGIPMYFNLDCIEEYFEASSQTTGGMCTGLCDSNLRAQEGNGFIHLPTTLAYVDTLPFEDEFWGHLPYAEVALKDTLYPGKDYYISWHQSTPIDSSDATEHLGILFTDSLVNEQIQFLGVVRPILTEPQVSVDSVQSFVYNEWDKYEACFHVDEPEWVMTVGFFGDTLEMQQVNLGGFYSFDNFYLAEISDSIALEVSQDTICAGDCVALSTNHSQIPGQFLWQLPGSDLGSSTDSAVVVCYDSPGVYEVSIQVEHCTGLYEQIFPQAIVVLPALEHDPIDTLLICAGERFTIPYDPQYAFRWLDDYPEVDRAFSLSGSYPYELRSGACIDTFHLPVELRVQPASQDTQLFACPGDSISYLGQLYTASGIYYDTLQSSELCDSVYQSISIQFYVPDPLEIEGDPVLCGEDTTFIRISTPGAQIQWQDGAQGPSRFFSAPGYYPFSYIDTNGCLYLDSLHIIRHEAPQVTTQDLLEITFTEPIELPVQYIGAIEEYLWFGHPLDALDCSDCPFPNLTLPKAGHYTIQVENQHGCKDTAHLIITLASSEVYIPNVLSLLATHPADRSLFPQADFDFRYELEVYNRWGSQIFHTRNAQSNLPRNGWKPSEDIQTGVYLYILRYQFNGRTIQKAGDITVLR